MQPGPGARTIRLSVTQGCSTPLHWNALVTTKTGGHWLNIGSTSGTTPSSHVVSVNATGLKPGVYSGSIIFHCSAGSLTLPVTFTIGQPTTPIMTTTPASMAPCIITDTPSALSFAGVVGQPTPATQAATISASGTCTHTLNWTASAGNTTWLTTSPTSGTVSVNSTSATNIGIVLSGLGPNTYTGQVTITATDSITHQSVGTPHIIMVTLRVIVASSLTVSPSSNGLTINVTSGTMSQAFSINNTGGEPLNWTVALGAGAPFFVSLSAGAGTNLLGGASVSDNVIVNATGVPGGTSYSTSVTVSAFDPITGHPVAGSRAIPITINIVPPSMQLNTNTLVYSTSVGVNPQVQSVNLTNSGGDGLTWKASSSQSWLKLGLTKGSDNYQQTSTIPFNVDATGLASGFYKATVVISPSVGAAQIVTVTLTVT